MTTISIVGLGAGDLEQLPLGMYRHLLAETNLYVRTKDHPVIKDLEQEGVSFTSFDDMYEKHEHFNEVYVAIVEELIKAAQSGPLTYAVPGHPLVAERTVQLLLEKAQNGTVNVKVLGGQSFLDPMYSALGIDPIEGCQIVDGTALIREELQVRHHLIICQVYDALVASDVKLTLMELLPDDYPVTIATAVGTKGERIETVPLFELDRVATLNNLTAVYVPPVKDEVLLYQDFNQLREVIRTLRGPNGCPWDKKQTHQSLKRYLLEEAYEVLEAIDEEDDDHLAEELGDLLLQVMLHAQIGEDEGWFSIDDVIRSITAKMIRRHPHVFGDSHAEDAEAVVQTWEQIKKEERGDLDTKSSVLDSISKGLPGLMLAYDLQKGAAKVGFDWTEVAPVWMKLQEEIAEFMVEVKGDNRGNMLKEFGDILFVLVNLGRFYGLHAEEAIHETNVKFKRRFQAIEQEVQAQGKQLSDFSLEELDAIWDDVKEKEKRGKDNAFR
ncbi:bifunctional methyltransferase/pyrophosphohydrolase YabN [Halalkalibacterium ligniniphilum]|uniref:nucleoside triphosphate pyrophosphohydrolase n=1 Tax=Halalkalibacterium ligniniphilum TaxID=1134413 RepID=UPI00034521A1|nr:nucleoside triphosphate pyrophosphohydrolase [Halalkalibacterium ligniniphilum]